MTLKEIIKTDLFRYAGTTDVKSFIYHFRYSTGFKFIFFYRISCYSKRFGLRGLIGNYYYKKLTYKYGYQISKTSRIGKGFLIRHFGHVVVNSKAVIGDNCNIYHGVTIGATFRGKNKGVPVIGNCVWIGAGAAVVGGIIIGNNVVIAPNSYVNFSVPDNSIVFGNPGILKERINATDGYIENIA